MHPILGELDIKHRFSKKRHYQLEKILITGASGFIGSFLVEHALQEGMEVWAAVRKSSSRRYLQDPRIHFLTLDFSNLSVLTTQLEAHRKENGSFAHVIHAAGATKCRHPQQFFSVNAEGTKYLAKALVLTGALAADGRFVFISSLSVMGPVAETDYHPISLQDHPRPNTAYGASKLLAESYLSEIEGLNYVVLRPTGVYGPRERDYALMADSIRRHVDFAVGYRRQVITFIYVADLVQAAFLALSRGKRGSVYFLTDGQEYSSRAFSDLIQEELGVRHVLHIKAPLWVLRVVSWGAERLARLTGTLSTLNSDKYRIMRQRNWRCDIRPAQEQLGYHPEWPLSRGVKATFGSQA